ncbi:putative NAD-dependent epimerase/dehydratase [Cafeteria roenbergensis virus]|uniref:Putative NAD-dependent epimerase/dehydratase n=1 Tax=Cafeteria roenbergensis virus (strain BV-PW1) TaxID=693272 RepID=E3T4Y8_CROVB|nr:nucleotide-sugar epimerase [Cafeteria roenbergensis virus BV-PW1]ADO67251.1 putative NAD-dependent epimerase/dehydratase [Cafeteria roenbergensis virus BV-PW1]
MTHNKTLLITGGCGFIGSHLVEKLSNKYKQVIIIDNLSTGYLKNIEPFLTKYNNLIYLYGDLTNLEFLRNVFTKYNINQICHQAAIGSVPRSVDDPMISHNNNVNAFINLLLCCKDYNVKRFVYASSSSVYGDNEILPKVESKIGNVLSPYAATKKINEIYANVFWRCYGIETIGMRYFNVFGPRQDPKGAYAAVIPKFIDLMKHNKNPIINGDGTFSRDFTFIDNVVEANYLALNTTNIQAFGEAFNIGAGGNITIGELGEIIKTHLRFQGEIIKGPSRKGDIQHSHANISKAQSILGYYPAISFTKGISILLKNT